MTQPLTAVHVSSCGSHIVALKDNCQLLLLYNFERLIRGEVAFDDAALEIYTANDIKARYLAYEQDKVAVASASRVFLAIHLANAKLEFLYLDFCIRRCLSIPCSGQYVEPGWFAIHHPVLGCTIQQ